MLKKDRIHAHCERVLLDKMAVLRKTIDQVMESVQGEEKSSAGDKFETARAMGQMEAVRISGQLSVLEHDLNILKNLNPAIVAKKIQVGSLVQTSSKWLFLSIGLGRLQIEGSELFAISAGSPLAQNLVGKLEGDEIHFGSNTETILKVL
jgi:transcription elongation GreA/GreB family factor